AANGSAVGGHKKGQPGSARVSRRRKSDRRGRAGFDPLPAAPAVIAAIHAAMVLLIESVRHARSHHDAMHALADVRILLPLRQEVRTRAAIARLPACGTIRRVAHAGCPALYPEPA